MKYLYCTLLFIFCGLDAHSQIETFADASVSFGTGKYLRQSAPGFHLGGTMHCMAGLQYGVFSLNAGLGVIALSDRLQVGGIESAEAEWGIGIDLPVGAALRIPVNNSLFVIGADVSFIGSFAQMVQPHIDWLFSGGGGYRGLFLKGFSSLKSARSYEQQYIGIGFKMTFG